MTRKNLADLNTLEEKLGVSFKDKSKLINSLVHSSYVNENPGYLSNERLEFLGDAVLGLVIAEKLYESLPESGEGDLTRKRAALVSRDNLARLARRIGLGEYLLLGKGEEATNGRTKLVNLSGAMESVIAAVYFDQGLEKTCNIILKLMEEDINKVTSESREIDYKSQLQELTQAQGKGIPVYRLTGTSGPDHARVFTIEVLVQGEVLATASGKSKKIAETDAARKALEAVHENGTGV